MLRLVRRRKRKPEKMEEIRSENWKRRNENKNKVELKSECRVVR